MNGKLLCLFAYKRIAAEWSPFGHRVMHVLCDGLKSSVRSGTKKQGIKQNNTFYIFSIQEMIET